MNLKMFVKSMIIIQQKHSYMSFRPIIQLNLNQGHGPEFLVGLVASLGGQHFYETVFGNYECTGNPSELSYNVSQGKTT